MLKDYEPINMIGCFYNFYLKHLHKKTQKNDHQTSQHTSQMAFISDRNITDAVLIAQKCLDSRLKTGEPGIICKLDIGKAFDHVNSNFLLNLLSQMGLGPNGSIGSGIISLL